LPSVGAKLIFAEVEKLRFASGEVV